MGSEVECATPGTHAVTARAVDGPLRPWGWGARYVWKAEEIGFLEGFNDVLGEGGSGHQGIV